MQSYNITALHTSRIKGEVPFLAVISDAKIPSYFDGEPYIVTKIMVTDPNNPLFGLDLSEQIGTCAHLYENIPLDSPIANFLDQNKTKFFEAQPPFPRYWMMPKNIVQTYRDAMAFVRG